jgi:carboxymethylenebutenolidase
MKQISRPFPRGECPIRCFGSDDAAAPVVLFFPDAFGLRPAADAVGEELAANGWRVLMPDPFYQYGDYDPIAPKSIFEAGPAHDRLMAMFTSITPTNIADDAAALLAVAAELSDPETPFASVGFCMGGRFALSAACQSARVRFAGAIHASMLAPVDAEGPHKHFAQVRGRIYIGVAGIDPSFGSEEHGRLAQALREADTDHIIENYQGAAHGWVFPDIPIYNAAAAARLMRRLQANLGEVF